MSATFPLVININPMLICNNCNSENPDGTTRCHQCNMGGNFTYQPNGTSPRREMLTLEKSLIQCLNCGSESPGDGDHCHHCRFPLDAARPGKQDNLRKGEGFSQVKTG